MKLLTANQRVNERAKGEILRLGIGDHLPDERFIEKTNGAPEGILYESHTVALCKVIGPAVDEIAQLEVLRDRYRDAQEAEKKSSAQLRANNQSLFTLVQKASTEVGLPVPDLQERRTPVKDSADLQEVSVDVNMKEISVDKLTTLLEKIEGKRSDGIVKVTKLKVKTRFDNPEMLEANLTVSTWRSSAAAPPAEGTKP